jgi:hypothetical protein
MLAAESPSLYHDSFNETAFCQANTAEQTRVSWPKPLRYLPNMYLSCVPPGGLESPFMLPLRCKVIAVKSAAVKEYGLLDRTPGEIESTIYLDKDKDIDIDIDR